MFFSWSQLITSIILCGSAIAATAAPSYVSRRQDHQCNSNPHKWGVSYQGNIVGWLGAPNSAHPNKIGLVLDASAAHTFHNTCMNRSPAQFSMICDDCDPKSNMLQLTLADMKLCPGVSNATMMVAAAPTDTFALMDVPSWDFDGTQIDSVAVGNAPTVSAPFCYYDPTKLIVSILAVTQSFPDATVPPQNCKIVAH